MFQDKENAIPQKFSPAALNKQYQDAIKNYQGADPLQPFLEYANWLLDTYNEDAEDLKQRLAPVLEACFKRCQDEKYKNNRKFMRLWIMYADLSEHPEDVFSTLEQRGIGSELAMYYQAYALVKENQELYEQADKLYKEGIKCRAEPVNQLQQAYQAFQERWQQEQSNPSPKRVREPAVVVHSAKKVALPPPQESTSHSNEVKEVSGYSMKAIVHPVTGEEICFEEYRALLRFPKVEVHSDSTKDISKIIKQNAMIGSALLNSPVKDHHHKEDLQSFLASSSSSTPSVSAKAKPTNTPTIHTRAALDLAYGMFKDSPGFSSSSLTDEIGFSSGRALSPGRRPACSPIAFTVFADPTTKLDDVKLDLTLPSPIPTMSSPQDAETPAAGLAAINPDLTPILETSREDDLDDFIDSKAWMQYLTQLGAHVSTKPSPLLESVLDGTEPAFELGDHLLHVESVLASPDQKGNWHVLMQDLDEGDNGMMEMNVTVPLPLEVDPCQWEYHIGKLLNKRGAESKSLSLPQQLYVFDGISCTLKPRLDKGSFHDVATAYHRTGKPMPEAVVMFYSIEMLRALELVHDMDVLHCNINLNSVFVRNEECDKWEDGWRLDGTGGWNTKGIALSGWGLAVDARSEPHCRFRNSKIPALYAQARGKGQAWSRALDRYQLASVIFTLLHGLPHSLQCISRSGRQVVTRPFLNEWNREMWTRTFDQLLNGDTPLKEIRQGVARALQEAGRTSNVKTLLCQQAILLC